MFRRSTHHRYFICIILSLATVYSVSAQTITASGTAITTYVSVVHPIVTFSSDETFTNFQYHYTVGFPIGINFRKPGKPGLSLEIAPFIRVTDKSSKMAFFLFHPGVLIPLGKGFTFTERAAFETSGRYGLTSVISKVIKKSGSNSYYVAMPFPLRFGNDQPTTFSIALQFGVSF